MAKTLLPPGFRFHPTDVELIKYYLKRKVTGRKFHGFDAIAEVDIYKYAPWDLPGKSCLKSGDLKWYFFCPREKKYANGARMNRATDIGYWKTTGKDRSVHYNNDIVGKIKTLVFHTGKAPRGERTDWVMHEYRIEEKNLADRGVVQDAYVLCIIFQKDGPGPRNGAQYGAPFKEEDWEVDDDDDDDENVNCIEVGSSNVHSLPAPNQTSPVPASSSCLSDGIPSACNVLSPIPENNGVSSGAAPVSDEHDIVSMLDMFTEDSAYVQNENFGNEHNENIESLPHFDGIYNELGDLGNLSGFGENVSDSFFNGNANYGLNQSFSGDDAQFLELRDLDVPIAEFCDFDAPSNGPTEAGASGLIKTTDELHPNQNCYNSEQSCSTVCPWSSQLPPIMLEHCRDKNPLITYPENSLCGRVEQAPLDHGDAIISNPLPTGSNGASEDLIRGGFYYPV